jgi:uncharacterized membrane protein
MTWLVLVVSAVGGVVITMEYALTMALKAGAAGTAIWMVITLKTLTAGLTAMTCLLRALISTQVSGRTVGAEVLTRMMTATAWLTAMTQTAVTRGVTTR